MDPLTLHTVREPMSDGTTRYRITARVVTGPNELAQIIPLLAAIKQTELPNHGDETPRAGDPI